MDSEDQQNYKKCDIDDDDNEEDGDAVEEYKVDAKCCDQFDTNGNHIIDKNQSEVDCAECDCVEVKVDSKARSTRRQSNEGLQKDESVMEKIMAMTLTDYGELSRSFVSSGMSMTERVPPEAIEDFSSISLESD